MKSHTIVPMKGKKNKGEKKNSSFRVGLHTRPCIPSKRRTVLNEGGPHFQASQRAETLFHGNKRKEKRSPLKGGSPSRYGNGAREDRGVHRRS